MATNNDQWINNIGEHQPKDPIDDIRSIDLNLDELVAKFMTPIDRFRSHVAADVKGPLIQSNLATSILPKESRCHAFYRMLGLPTIAPDGTFFSPGFPLVDEEHRQEISDKMQDSNIKNAIAEREISAQKRLSLFSTRSSDTVVFSIAMGVSDGQRKFTIDVGTLSDATSKPQTIPARTQYINKFFQNVDGSSITNTFQSVSHQLAPFITDPIIAQNVEPKSGSNSILVGQPFLDKSDLEFESGKYAKRPGLEFILRIKLREQLTFNSLQLGNIANEMPVLVTDANGLINLGINEDDVEKLSELGLFDVIAVVDLFKTYIGLINVYYNALNTIENVRKQIIWIPLPGEGGPESGSVVSTSYVQPIRYLDSWNIERRIANLKVKAAMAKYQLDLGTNPDDTNLVYGDFSISEFQNVSDTIDADLSNEESKRSALETQGSNALRTIEFLGGEVSGLGLIDVVAIYLSLWSLDTPTLLNLIDDAAAIRLNNISDLQTSDTQSRSSTQANAADAYNKLATQVKTILDFGDYVFTRLKGSPKEGSIGNIQNTG